MEAFVNMSQKIWKTDVLSVSSSPEQMTLTKGLCSNVSFPNLVINVIQIILDTRPTPSDIHMTVTNLRAFGYFGPGTLLKFLSSRLANFYLSALFRTLMIVECL